MTRNALLRQIKVTHQRLHQRQKRLKVASQQLNAALQKLHPYLTIGIGLIAGALTRKIGWRKFFSGLSASVELYPFVIKYLSSAVDPKNEK